MNGQYSPERGWGLILKAAGFTLKRERSKRAGTLYVTAGLRSGSDPAAVLRRLATFRTFGRDTGDDINLLIDVLPKHRPSHCSPKVHGLPDGPGGHWSLREAYCCQPTRFLGFPTQTFVFALTKPLNII